MSRQTSISNDFLKQDSKYRLAELVDYYSDEDIDIPHIFPIGKVVVGEQANEGLGHFKGLKVYDRDTEEISVKTYGEIVDMALGGTKIAGVDVKATYSCDDIMIPILSGIELKFETDYYNLCYMSTVDDTGKQLTSGFNTLIGTDISGDEVMFITIDASGNTKKLNFHEFYTSALLGVDIGRSRSSLAAILPIKGDTNYDKE